MIREIENFRLGEKQDSGKMKVCKKRKLGKSLKSILGAFHDRRERQSL